MNRIKTKAKGKYFFNYCPKRFSCDLKLRIIQNEKYFEERKHCAFVVRDDNKNQYPISKELSFEHSTLGVDYRNDNYDKLAVMDSYGENHMNHKRWKQNNYSNDIEVIGNIGDAI